MGYPDVCANNSAEDHSGRAVSSLCGNPGMLLGEELDMHRLGIRIPVGNALKHIHMKSGFFMNDEKAEKGIPEHKVGIRSHSICVMPELC